LLKDPFQTILVLQDGTVLVLKLVQFVGGTDLCAVTPNSAVEGKRYARSEDNPHESSDYKLFHTPSKRRIVLETLRIPL
jgi:hypothetical protein